MKYNRRFLATCLAGAMMVGFTACGSDAGSTFPEAGADTQTSGAADGKIRLGFSSAAFSDEWCKNLAESYKELAASEYPQFEVIVLDGQIDAEKQINTIDSLIQQGMDYIAVQPLGGTSTALKQVNDAGIPLFCVDMVPEDASLVWTQIGVDETMFGKLQADALAEVLPENGTVCIVMNKLGMNSQIYRTQGFEEQIASIRPDVKILDAQTSDSDTAKAMNLVEDWLQRFGEDGVNAIVSQSAQSTQGIVESLKAHNLVGKVNVASVDCPSPSGPEWLESKATVVDVFYDYTALARATFDAILRYEETGKQEESIMIDPVAVTVDNCADYK